LAKKKREEETERLLNRGDITEEQVRREKAGEARAKRAKGTGGVVVPSYRHEEERDPSFSFMPRVKKELKENKSRKSSRSYRAPGDLLEEGITKTEESDVKAKKEAHRHRSRSHRDSHSSKSGSSKSSSSRSGGVKKEEGSSSSRSSSSRHREHSTHGGSSSSRHRSSSTRSGSAQPMLEGRFKGASRSTSVARLPSQSSSSRKRPLPPVPVMGRSGAVQEEDSLGTVVESRDDGVEGCSPILPPTFKGSLLYFFALFASAGFSEDWVKKERELDRSWYDMDEGGAQDDDGASPFLGRYASLAA